MITDSKGREVYISVYGRDADDIEIDEAYYVDNNDDVPEKEIEYIMDVFSDEIYDKWYDLQIGYAESFYEMDQQ